MKFQVLALALSVVLASEREQELYLKISGASIGDLSMNGIYFPTGVPGQRKWRQRQRPQGNLTVSPLSMPSTRYYQIEESSNGTWTIHNQGWVESSYASKAEATRYRSDSSQANWFQPNLALPPVTGWVSRRRRAGTFRVEAIDAVDAIDLPAAPVAGQQGRRSQQARARLQQAQAAEAALARQQMLDSANSATSRSGGYASGASGPSSSGAHTWMDEPAEPAAQGDDDTCEICYDNLKDAVFQCGHSCCRVCAKILWTTQKRCHMCREPLAVEPIKEHAGGRVQDPGHFRVRYEPGRFGGYYFE